MVIIAPGQAWERRKSKLSRHLGYTFQPRRAKNRYGKHFVSFLPAISTKSANKIRATIRKWRIAATRNNQSLEDLAKLCDPYVRGWMNYYGRFYRSKCV
jgi:RNA-directed DNA polymerase